MVTSIGTPSAFTQLLPYPTQGLFLLHHSAPTQSLHVLKHSVSSIPPLPNGVLPARTKKKLRSSFRQGTPNTAAAAEEVLKDMARGVVCSATYFTGDAANGCVLFSKVTDFGFYSWVSEIMN